MTRITFHMNVKGCGRTVIAERVRRGEKITYNWLKPACVIDGLRKDPYALVEQEGDHIRLDNFGALAKETDASEKEQANAFRSNGAVIGWMSYKWMTFRSDARNILGWMSDGNVLDNVRRAKSEGLDLHSVA